MALTIGQVAKEAGVGVETVRFYERKALIEQPPRPARGFRRYPPDVVRRIRFIQRAQGLGFTLREIGELLALRVEPATACGDVRAVAERKVARDRRQGPRAPADAQGIAGLDRDLRRRRSEQRMPDPDCAGPSEGDAAMKRICAGCGYEGSESSRPLRARHRRSRAVAGALLGATALGCFALPRPAARPAALDLGWLGASHLVAAMTGYPGCPELGAIPSLVTGRRVATRCGPWERFDARTDARVRDAEEKPDGAR